MGPPQADLPVVFENLDELRLSKPREPAQNRVCLFGRFDQK